MKQARKPNEKMQIVNPFYVDDGSGLFFEIYTNNPIKTFCLKCYGTDNFIKINIENENIFVVNCLEKTNEITQIYEEEVNYSSLGINVYDDGKKQFNSYINFIVDETSFFDLFNTSNRPIKAYYIECEKSEIPLVFEV